MRRLFMLVMAVGLFGSTSGCKHVAGICDCQYFGYSGLCCYGGYCGCAYGNCGGPGPHGGPGGSAASAGAPVQQWSGPVPPNWGAPVQSAEPLRAMPQPATKVPQTLPTPMAPGTLPAPMAPGTSN